MMRDNMQAALAALEAMPELSPYLDQPAQMPVGAPGKVGFLRLGFEMQGGRSVLADLYRIAPLLVQQALYWDEAMPGLPICMVTSIGGGTLQGDRLGMEINVGEGACAHVTTQGANRVHAMDANYASQTQTLTLADNAYLEFMPEITIPYRHARYACRTRIILPASATVICAESVMGGRKYHGAGERFAYDVLSLATSAFRPDGTPLFAEKLLIEPGKSDLDLPGLMQGFDVFGNLLILTPPDVAARIHARVPAAFDRKAGIASGLSRLPNHAGLMLRVVGRESYQVRSCMRECWAVAREEAVGASLPAEFLWR